MGKTKAPVGDIQKQLQLAIFMDAYRQSGFKPAHLVAIASRLPEGKEAIMKRALLLAAS